MILSTALVALPLIGAQAQESGGPLFRFGLTQEISHQSNPGLADPAADAETVARTRLSFDAISQTDVHSLHFSANGALEMGEGADDGLANPSVQLAYSRNVANAALSASVFLNEQDVDTLEFDFDNPIVTSAAGVGRQRQTGGQFGLSFGQDGPFGGEISLGRTDTRYSDTNDPDFIDNIRDTARLQLRFDLNPVNILTATAATSRLDEEGQGRSETTSLSLQLSNERPDGRVDITASATRNGEGQRGSLSLGRSLDLPSGALSARLGIGQTVSGGTELIGALDWQQDLPRGEITLALNQSVTENSRDDEIRLSGLSLGLSQNLTDRISGNIEMGLRNTVDTGDDAETHSATLSASMRYALTPDWNLGLSATHRMRDEDTAGRSESTDVSLSLSRVFEFRP